MCYAESVKIFSIGNSAVLNADKCTNNGAFPKQETAMKILQIAIKIRICWMWRIGKKESAKRLRNGKQRRGDSLSGGDDAHPRKKRREAGLSDSRWWG